MSKVSHSDVEAVIAEQFKREDLSTEDVLRLTIAKRLNDASENGFATALGGVDLPPLNFWGKR